MAKQETTTIPEAVKVEGVQIPRMHPDDIAAIAEAVVRRQQEHNSSAGAAQQEGTPQRELLNSTDRNIFGILLLACVITANPLPMLAYPAWLLWPPARRRHVNTAKAVGSFARKVGNVIKKFAKNPRGFINEIRQRRTSAQDQESTNLGQIQPQNSTVEGRGHGFANELSMIPEILEGTAPGLAGDAMGTATTILGQHVSDAPSTQPATKPSKDDKKGKDNLDLKPAAASVAEQNSAVEVEIPLGSDTGDVPLGGATSVKTKKKKKKRRKPTSEDTKSPPSDAVSPSEERVGGAAESVTATSATVASLPVGSNQPGNLEELGSASKPSSRTQRTRSSRGESRSKDTRDSKQSKSREHTSRSRSRRPGGKLGG